jgi:hypothetical protein
MNGLKDPRHIGGPTTGPIVGSDCLSSFFQRWLSSAYSRDDLPDRQPTKRKGKDFNRFSIRCFHNPFHYTTKNFANSRSTMVEQEFDFDNIVLDFDGILPPVFSSYLDDEEEGVMWEDLVNDNISLGHRNGSTGSPVCVALFDVNEEADWVDDILKRQGIDQDSLDVAAFRDDDDDVADHDKSSRVLFDGTYIFMCGHVPFHCRVFSDRVALVRFTQNPSVWSEELPAPSSDQKH